MFDETSDLYPDREDGSAKANGAARPNYAV
jgi:hypothetical protein